MISQITFVNFTIHPHKSKTKTLFQTLVLTFKDIQIRLIFGMVNSVNIQEKEYRIKNQLMS